MQVLLSPPLHLQKAAGLAGDWYGLRSPNFRAPSSIGPRRPFRSDLLLQPEEGLNDAVEVRL